MLDDLIEHFLRQVFHFNLNHRKVEIDHRFNALGIKLTKVIAIPD